jgi:hypothetical protein
MNSLTINTLEFSDLCPYIRLSIVYSYRAYPDRSAILLILIIMLQSKIYSPRRAFANVSASNGSMSSMVSPVPMNFTGIFN